MEKLAIHGARTTVHIIQTECPEHSGKQHADPAVCVLKVWLFSFNVFFVQAAGSLENAHFTEARQKLMSGAEPSSSPLVMERTTAS